MVYYSKAHHVIEDCEQNISDTIIYFKVRIIRKNTHISNEWVNYSSTVALIMAGDIQLRGNCGYINANNLRCITKASDICHQRIPIWRQTSAEAAGCCLKGHLVI